MKAWLGYGVVAVLAFGASLVLQAPAALLLPQALKLLPGTDTAVASFGQVGGTLLAGRAQQVRLGARQFEQLRWRWQPGGLWRGRLSYRLRMLEPGLDISAVVSVSVGAVLEIEALRGQLSLPRAIELTGRPAPPLGGRLELGIDLIRLPPPGGGLIPLAMTGQVWLREAYTAFGRTLQLGDFRAEFGRGTANNDVTNNAAPNVTGTLHDLGGPTELSGQFTLAANGSYRLSLQLSARSGADPAANAELSQALSLLGQPGQDGRWRLTIAGRLGFLLGPAL